ncbi:Alpha/Beta hydrolase protein, partial [Tricharina praecox]|uniref:Alpha/Beta hydrolase protein n=1 Tax=Tricharina praecox TaxID=43433 RepID=UPI0022205476
MSILSSTFACQTHTYQSAPTTALDVYKPANHCPASRHKTLILFHGGGLTTGSRDVFIPVGIATQLLNRGWIVISADYSLLPQASGLSLLRNLANIETWITENAAKEGIDTTNVAVGGESAGGYMSILA